MASFARLCVSAAQPRYEWQLAPHGDIILTKLVYLPHGPPLIALGGKAAGFAHSATTPRIPFHNITYETR